MGHWNEDGLGCSADMTTPTVYSTLKSEPKCAGIADKLKYFEGHAHCNEVVEKDVGFMVGANGMSQCG